MSTIGQEISGRLGLCKNFRIVEHFSTFYPHVRPILSYTLLQILALLFKQIAVDGRIARMSQLVNYSFHAVDR